MANGVLKGSSLGGIVKLVIKRFKHINKAPAKEIPQLDSHLQNQIKNALHPAVQYLEVAEIIKHSDDVKTFVFKADESKGMKRLAYFSAGQYLSISIKIGDITITRPYSLSSSPKESLEGKYSLTIKRVKDGLATNYILDNWTVGQKFVASAPLGTFVYEPLRDAKTVVGIAGGSGITPFYSMAKAIKDGTENFKLILIYGSRTKNDILFLDEFEAIQKECKNFKLVNVLSDEEVKGFEKGFITASIIKKYAPKSDYSVFVCGSQAMYAFADTEIAKLGIRNKFVRHELFGEYHNPENNADYPKDMINKEFKLTVTIDGETYNTTCKAGDTLLVSMEKAGIHAPANCRSGECGWCHSKLVSGNVYVPASVDGRRLADHKFGYIHPCCTFPLGDVELIVPTFRA